MARPASCHPERLSAWKRSGASRGDSTVRGRSELGFNCANRLSSVGAGNDTHQAVGEQGRTSAHAEGGAAARSGCGGDGAYPRGDNAQHSEHRSATARAFRTTSWTLRSSNRARWLYQCNGARHAHCGLHRTRRAVAARPQQSSPVAKKYAEPPLLAPGRRDARASRVGDAHLRCFQTRKVCQPSSIRLAA